MTTTMNQRRTIRAAAVQAVSRNGQVQPNLEHAGPFVRDAAEKGAELVLLPELLAAGFELNQSLWRAAEPGNGPTERWLKEQATTHSVWIGTSFLEAAGNQFRNTFVLVDAAGKTRLRVCKRRPAATEAFLYKGHETGRVADTPWGRIGVAICYESFLTETIRTLRSQRADLVLVPMSAPTPTLNKPLRKQDLTEYNAAIGDLAGDVAGELGVPVVMANKSGPWVSRSPWPFPREKSTFPGLSTIAAADGTVLARLGSEEGVAVADVDLDPEREAGPWSPASAKWARKPPRLFHLFVISETLGRVCYALSSKRRRAGRAVSPIRVSSD